MKEGVVRRVKDGSDEDGVAGYVIRENEREELKERLKRRLGEYMMG